MILILSLDISNCFVEKKRIMVSTNTKLLGDKMLNIIDRINLGENPNAGLKDLKDYVYETWKA